MCPKTGVHYLKGLSSSPQKNLQLAPNGIKEQKKCTYFCTHHRSSFVLGLVWVARDRWGLGMAAMVYLPPRSKQRLDRLFVLLNYLGLVVSFLGESDNPFHKFSLFNSKNTQKWQPQLCLATVIDDILLFWVPHSSIMLLVSWKLVSLLLVDLILWLSLWIGGHNVPHFLAIEFAFTGAAYFKWLIQASKWEGLIPQGFSFFFLANIITYWKRTVIQFFVVLPYIILLMSNLILYLIGSGTMRACFILIFSFLLFILCVLLFSDIIKVIFFTMTTAKQW